MGLQTLRQEVQAYRRIQKGLFELRDYPLTSGGPFVTSCMVDDWLAEIGYRQERILIMAGSKGKPKFQNNGFNGFVNFKLDQEAKKAFSKWVVSDDELWALLSELIMAGYKVSMSFNKQNGSFNCTLVCNDPSSPNTGYGLSSFAPDWFLALKTAIYKHVFVLEAVWPIGEAAARDDWG